MNINEAQSILLLYRPGTADAEDPRTAEALALAAREPELARWLAEHCQRQEVLRDRFRQIAVPAGLKEQIVSEQAARERRRRTALAAVPAVVALVLLLGWWLSRRPSDDTLAIYRNQMASFALRGYGMDLTTNDPSPIRAYLAQKQAPADYTLPAALQKAAVAGCAVEGWQNVKVAMICFRTGRPLSPNQASDLWLFVVDRASLRDPPPAGPPQVIAVNQLITAFWAQGDRVYLLGTVGDEATLRNFL